MRLSRRPSPPPHPHPRRGRGKKRGEGSAAGPRGRGAGGEPGGSPGRGRPGRGRREAAGLPLPGPAPSLRFVTTAAARFPAPGWSFPRSKFTLFGVRPPLLEAQGYSAARGHRGAPVALCALPRRLGLRANLRAGLGVSAPGRDRRPGGPRLRLVPSPALPSPCRRQSGGGGRGPFPGGVQGGRAERLSRSRAGGRRGRAGVGTSGRGHPRVASASTG